MPEESADLIVSSKKMADYFDEGAKGTKNLKALANWLLGDVSAFLNAEGIEIDDGAFKITPDHMAGLVNLIDKGVLSSKLAKKVFVEMLKDNEAPEALVKNWAWNRSATRANWVRWWTMSLPPTRSPWRTSRPARKRPSASSSVRL